jgi:hypothetical protein
LYSELSNSNKDVRNEKPYLQYSSSDERWWESQALKVDIMDEFQP